MMKTFFFFAALLFLGACAQKPKPSDRGYVCCGGVVVKSEIDSLIVRDIIAKIGSTGPKQIMVSLDSLNGRSVYSVLRIWPKNKGVVPCDVVKVEKDLGGISILSNEMCVVD
jgi:hypothetical protein